MPRCAPPPLHSTAARPPLLPASGARTPFVLQAACPSTHCEVQTRNASSSDVLRAAHPTSSSMPALIDVTCRHPRPIPSIAYVHASRLHPGGATGVTGGLRGSSSSAPSRVGFQVMCRFGGLLKGALQHAAPAPHSAVRWSAAAPAAAAHESCVMSHRNAGPGDGGGEGDALDEACTGQDHHGRPRCYAAVAAATSARHLSITAFCGFCRCRIRPRIRRRRRSG